MEGKLSSNARLKCAIVLVLCCIVLFRVGVGIICVGLKRLPFLILLPVLGRCCTEFSLKHLIEPGQVFKAAFHTDIRHREIAAQQEAGAVIQP